MIKVTLPSISAATNRNPVLLLAQFCEREVLAIIYFPVQRDPLTLRYRAHECTLSTFQNSRERAFARAAKWLVKRWCMTLTSMQWRSNSVEVEFGWCWIPVGFIRYFVLALHLGTRFSSLISVTLRFLVQALKIAWRWTIHHHHSSISTSPHKWISLEQPTTTNRVQ